MNYGGCTPFSIETLFGIFKSRGFNLEDTHLREFRAMKSLICTAHDLAEITKAVRLVLGISNRSVAI